MTFVWRLPWVIFLLQRYCEVTLSNLVCLICTPKVILSIYRKRSCLSAGKKSTSSFMLFWRLTVSILDYNSRTRILPHMGLVVKYQQQLPIPISFHLILFRRKSNDQIFQKIKKYIFWGQFGIFLLKFGQKRTFVEIRVLSFFKYSSY